MYASIFSYNISRSYPFRWFTPVVLVGGLVAVLLITFLSVATQGYEMITVYSSNPNVTITNKTYFARWPSYLTANTRSSCSSTTLPIGTEFYTNNTALKYELSSIWQGGDETKLQNFAGSLPYQNNPLNNCSITAITITFQGIERSAIQIAVQQWGAEMKAWINCGIETQDGLTNVQLTTSYDVNPPDVYGIDSARFVGRNQTTKPSLWWGESLLAWYSIAVTDDIHIANENFTTNDTPAVYKGYVNFVRGVNATSSTNDIKSLEFFDAGCFFVPFSDNGIESPVYFCHHDGMGNLDLVSNLVAARPSDANAPLPGIWISADALSKAFYSTILVDLGQVSSQPNLLVDPDLLAYFTKNITSINTRAKAWGDNLSNSSISGLSLSPFQNKDSSSQLGIHTSVISASYLCQVPQLKSTATLVVSVMINSIVLLSAIWKLFKLVIDSFLASKYPELKVCEGCLDVLYGQGDGRGLVSPKAASIRTFGDPGLTKAGYATVDQSG